MASGKSKSKSFPFGKRRRINGIKLASKSLRKKGKLNLKDCSKEELIKAGVGEKGE